MFSYVAQYIISVSVLYQRLRVAVAGKNGREIIPCYTGNHTTRPLCGKRHLVTLPQSQGDLRISLYLAI